MYIVVEVCVCVCAMVVIVYKINNENGKQWSIELGLHCESEDKESRRDRVGKTANQNKQLDQLWPKKNTRENLVSVLIAV